MTIDNWQVSISEITRCKRQSDAAAGDGDVLLKKEKKEAEEATSQSERRPETGQKAKTDNEDDDDDEKEGKELCKQDRAGQNLQRDLIKRERQKE